MDAARASTLMDCGMLMSVYVRSKVRSVDSNGRLPALPLFSQATMSVYSFAAPGFSVNFSTISCGFGSGFGVGVGSGLGVVIGGLGLIGHVIGSPAQGLYGLAGVINGFLHDGQKLLLLHYGSGGAGDILGYLLGGLG